MTFDDETKEAVLVEMQGKHKENFNFGEAVGLMVFRAWYPCVSYQGHFAYAPTYDFPVRLAFVKDPFDPAGATCGNPDWRAWNLPNWIHTAKQLEEDGVKAIVGGCGLTGMIQSLIAKEINIPFYSSTVLCVPMIHKTLPPGKGIGILTVSEFHFRLHDNILLEECGVSDDISVVVQGMNEAAPEDAAAWLTMTTPDYDLEKVKQAVVNTVVNMVKNNPDMGTIVLECTEMPVYADAIREAVNLPVFDAVDMVKMVHNMVRPK